MVDHEVAEPSEQDSERLDPADGFQCFSTGDRFDHFAAYAVGGLLWGITYSVGASIPSAPRVAVVGGATLAAGVTGLYFFFAYTRAVGSPYGNIVASLLLTLGLPYQVHAWLGPEAVTVDYVTVLLRSLYLSFPIFVSLSFPVVCLVLWHELADRRQWDDRVMPAGFSMEDRFLGRGRSAQEQFERTWNPFGYVAYGLIAAVPVVVFSAIVLFLLPTAWGVHVDHIGGTVLVATYLVYVWLPR